MKRFNARHIGLASLVFLALVLPCSALGQPAPDSEPEYLGAGELTAIGAGSVAAWLIGSQVNNFDSTRGSLWSGPLPGEAWIERTLGGRYYPGKTNFLDNDFGSGLTAGIGVVAIGTADLAWPQGDREKDLGQNLYLYLMGLAATKGVTSIVKGAVARPRPLVVLEPELAAQRTEIDPTYDRHSFFSGHTSSAFFSMAYTNKRIRSVMRSEMSSNDYRDWRWVSPAVTFGWATFVAWSRIHAYKHYLSDVVVGALVGWGLAELFYEFGDDTYEDLSPNSGDGLYLKMSFPL